MPSLLPRPDRWARSLVLSHRLRPSPDYRRVGSCISCFGACSAFTRVTACRLAKSPKATLYTEGFSSFVTSTTAPIATGWSEPVPRVGLSPTVNQRLFTAHVESRCDAVVWRRPICLPALSSAGVSLAHHAPFSHPAHRTGQAHFAHPAPGERLTRSHT